MMGIENTVAATDQQLAAEGVAIDWALVAFQRGARAPTDQTRRVHLRWFPHPQSGYPITPFEVYRREHDPDAQGTRVKVAWQHSGTHLAVVGEPLALIRFEVSGAGVVKAYATDPKPGEIVDLARPQSAGSVVLRAHRIAHVTVEGTTVVDGSITGVTASDNLKDDAWQLHETVGWGDPADINQFLAPAPELRLRLERSLPQVGWYAKTPSGLPAPAWTGVDDLDAAIADISDRLGQRLGKLLDTDPSAQHEQRDDPETSDDGPSFTLQRNFSDLEVMLMAAATDPVDAVLLNLGAAFDELGPDDLIAKHDYAVVSRYGPNGDGFGAYVPAPRFHDRLITPQGLRVEWLGLVEPTETNGSWEEDFNLRWATGEFTALAGRPLAAAAILSTEDGPELFPERLRRGRSRGAPMGPSGSGPDVVLTVPGVERPPTPEVLRRDFAVASTNNFGIWSKWAEVSHASQPTVVPEIQLLQVDAEAKDHESGICPVAGTATVTLNWLKRTWDAARIHVISIDAQATPPTSPPTTSRTFNVDLSSATGDDIREYKIPFTTEADFTSGAREATVVVWGEGQVTGQPSRVNNRWRSTAVANPMEIKPIDPPPPEGVPVGSKPTQQRRSSHVAVVYRLPAGAPPGTAINVWEMTESTLRDLGGLQLDPDPPREPHERLAELESVHNKARAEGNRPELRLRRSGGSRLADGLTGTVDVALPAGSTEIHLFAVTAVSPTGVESPKPTQWEALQPFMAPRVLPAPAPLLTAQLQPDGQLRLEARCTPTSPDVRIKQFLFYRADPTRLAQPASASGPPIATSAATEDGSSWVGDADIKLVAHSWLPHTFRAVAVPERSVPLKAITAEPSPPSNTTSISVRPPAVELSEVQISHESNPDRILAGTRFTPARTGNKGYVVYIDGDVDAVHRVPVPLGEIPALDASSTGGLTATLHAAGEIELTFVTTPKPRTGTFHIHVVDPAGRRSSVEVNPPSTVELPKLSAIFRKNDRSTAFVSISTDVEARRFFGDVELEVRLTQDLFGRDERTFSASLNLSSSLPPSPPPVVRLGELRFWRPRLASRDPVVNASFRTAPRLTTTGTVRLLRRGIEIASTEILEPNSGGPLPPN